MKGVNNVLNAAALTYVAALVTSVMQMMYWISVVYGNGWTAPELPRLVQLDAEKITT